jgi:hypothetical protein
MKDDKIEKAFFDLTMEGFIPKISLENGRINKIYCQFTNQKIKTVFIIHRQQLISDSLGSGDIPVSEATVYNKMNSVMCDMYNSLFLKEHKSYYNQDDINVLDKYRTIVPLGILSNIKDKSKLIEMDVRKAFTSSFCKIKKNPVFNEFDIFKKYDNSKIKNYNLYIVRYLGKKTNLFLMVIRISILFMVNS